MENINKLIPKIVELHKKREGLSDGEMTQREANLVVCCLEQFEIYIKSEGKNDSTEERQLTIPDVSNLLPLDNCIVEWEKFIKQHNLKGNAGVMSVYFGMFLHGWRGRNSEGFWQ